VASLVGNSHQGGPGPSGLIHEEAHPIVMYAVDKRQVSNKRRGFWSTVRINANV